MIVWDFIKRSIRLLAISGWLLAVAASCKVGPSYQRVAGLDDARSWKNQTLEDSAYVRNSTLFDQAGTIDNVKIESQWWKVFEDDTLNQLIEKAFSNNPTLRTAGFRIMESRQLVNTARANYYPVLSVDPGISRNQLSANR